MQEKLEKGLCLLAELEQKIVLIHCAYCLLKKPPANSNPSRPRVSTWQIDNT